MPRNRALSSRSLSPGPQRKTPGRTRSLSPRRFFGRGGNGSPGPHRAPRNISADRDPAYSNILCTESLMSTPNILKHVEAVQDDAAGSIKLELEDLVLRTADQHEIIQAVHSVIHNLNNSSDDDCDWNYIQFTDSMDAYGRDDTTDEDGPARAMETLGRYKTQIEELRDHLESPPRRDATTDRLKEQLKAFAHRASCVLGDSSATRCEEEDDRHKTGLPLLFQMRLCIHGGTALEGLLAILDLLAPTPGRERLELTFGGALYGHGPETVPEKLRALFQKIPADGAGDQKWQLRETVVLNLTFSTPIPSPQHERLPLDSSGIVSRCVRALAELKVSSQQPQPTSKDDDAKDPKRKTRAPTSSISSRNHKPADELRRKKSDASLGSTSHSTGKMTPRTKKQRRRSKSLSHSGTVAEPKVSSQQSQPNSKDDAKDPDKKAQTSASRISSGDHKPAELRRKKSDASLGSTSHSTRKMTPRTKKQRRRSKSLPHSGSGLRPVGGDGKQGIEQQKDPPDFRWDRLDHLDLKPKLSGSAA